MAPGSALAPCASWEALAWRRCPGATGDQRFTAGMRCCPPESGGSGTAGRLGRGGCGRTVRRVGGHEFRLWVSRRRHVLHCCRWPPGFRLPDQPPLVPLLCWAMNQLAPGSLAVLRLPSALAAAACCAASSGFALATGHIVSTTTFDVLATTTVGWLLIRAVRSRSGPSLLLAGLVAGPAPTAATTRSASGGLPRPTRRTSCSSVTSGPRTPRPSSPTAADSRSSTTGSDSTTVSKACP